MKPRNTALFHPLKSLDFIYLNKISLIFFYVFELFRFCIIFCGCFLLSGCYIKGSITELEQNLKTDKTNSSTTTTVPISSSTTTTTLPNLPTVSLDINSGAASTTALTVSLSITASIDATEMYITNTSGCSAGGVWETVANSKSNWALGGTNSTQSVYIKIRNASLTESSCVSHSINQSIQVNAITVLSGDIANNSLTTSPTFTFNYSTTGNTYSLDYFEVSIGTTVGATNILNWTSIASSQAFSESGLTLTQDTDYFINVRAKDSMGNVSTNVSSSWRAVAGVTVSARFAAATNWMDYVKVSNTAQACDNTVNGYYNCLHGGEKKTITVTGENSCTGLSAYDALGVFTWTCVAGSPVSFITKEVKSGKGLKDLVTASGWINNRVFVIKNGYPLKASTYAVWWSNSITNLPANTNGPAPLSLSSSGTIYVVNTDMTSHGYQFTVNKIGVVVKSGYTLKLNASVASNCYNGNFKCLFFGSNSSEIGSFSWFEGHFDGNNISASFWSGFDIDHAVFNNSHFFNWIYSYSGNLSSSLFRSNIVTKSSSGMAFYAENSGDSTYRDNKFINSHIEFTDSSSFNIVNNNLVYSDYGIHTPGNNDNVTSFNSIMIDGGQVNFGGSTKSTLHNLYVAGDLVLNFLINTKLTFSHLASNTLRIYGNGSSQIKFSGVIGFNGCDTASGMMAPNDGINATCGLIAPSNATAVTIGNLKNSVLGLINSDTHFSGYSSTTGFPFSNLSSQTFFDNIFTGILDTNNTNCGTGDTCYLHSAKLKSTDTVVLNKSGNLSTTNSAFPTLSTDPCPAEVHGNITATDQLTTPNTYLLNAMEIIGDEIGDDNGLCESNETCIYAPNIGAYQGSGDYTTKSCVFQNGTVTGVKMYAYPTNGE